ncbi:hypothetical protein [Streptomyces clavifer]|uniref:hypothetical protein n=1 Tax=Streptomyces clavifer TaxID=68188 RepID=UPI00365BC646
MAEHSVVAEEAVEDDLYGDQNTVLLRRRGGWIRGELGSHAAMSPSFTYGLIRSGAGTPDKDKILRP